MKINKVGFPDSHREEHSLNSHRIIGQFCTFPSPHSLRGDPGLEDTKQFREPGLNMEKSLHKKVWDTQLGNAWSLHILLVRGQDGYNLSSLGSLSAQKKELARAPVLGPNGHPFYF